MEKDTRNGDMIYGVIDDMEDYLAGCKNKFMSTTEVVVDRGQMEDFLRELRRKAPEEIEHARRVVKNREAILDDARNKAQALIDQAEAQTDELISQNEIMRRAYDQADTVVSMANQEAINVREAAYADAEAIRANAEQYMDDVLTYLESLVGDAMKHASKNYEDLIGTLTMFQDRITSDHSNLHPDDYGPETAAPQEGPGPEAE